MILNSLQYKESKRYKILSEAEEIILHGAAVLPINNQPAFNVIDLTVIEGWFPNPLDIHPFKYLYFTSPKLIPGVVSRSLKKPYDAVSPSSENIAFRLH